MTSPPQRKLYFVTGKGGVGKTCVAASLAHRLAADDLRVLLVEIGGVSSLGRHFGVESVAYDPQEVAPGILISRITSGECLREYGLMKLRIRKLYDLVFENPFVKSLINLMPGMEELLLIGKLGYLVQAIDKDPKKARWDVVVVDAPPTGQGAGLLSLPSTVLATVKAGPVAREVAQLQRIITDADTTAICIVTNPEELAIDEALELETELTQKNGLPLTAVIANKTIGVRLGRQDAEILQTYLHARRAGGNLSGNYPLYATAATVIELLKNEDIQLRRLRLRSKAPIIELPLVGSDDGTTPCERLSNRLTGLLDQARQSDRG
jgi:anion-transporting  ArsA/GET3 family ATPase